jgi:hypothetical protein
MTDGWEEAYLASYNSSAAYQRDGRVSPAGTLFTGEVRGEHAVFKFTFDPRLRLEIFQTIRKILCGNAKEHIVNHVEYPFRQDGGRSGTSSA